MTNSPAPGVVIVGGGIAGYTVAAELRAVGFADPITIIDPLGVPYDRPPLSKEYLQGEPSSTAAQFQPAQWYAEKAITLVTGEVTAINAQARTLLLADATTRSYDILVLATGGQARRGTTPGFSDERVIVLRTREDADQLRAALGQGKRLGIIGAGLIGAEVAATASAAGTEVTLIDPVAVAIVPAVGIELATRLHELHAEHGVTVRRGLTAGIAAEGDAVRIEIVDAEPVTVDAVLLCIGLVIDESLARTAGLACDGGVLVDQRQRTADPHIWAVGDCARTLGEDGVPHRRHEHWDSAVQEAVAAARDIAGAQPPVPSAPWFWSDRYGHHVEGVGEMTSPGTTVIRPDAEGRPAVAFRLDESGRLVGAAAIDDAKAVRAVRRMIDRGIAADPAQLADPAVALKKLLR